MLQKPGFGIINCRSRIVSRLLYNEIDFATRGKFVLINLELSELCRKPAKVQFSSAGIFTAWINNKGKVI